MSTAPIQKTALKEKDTKPSEPLNRVQSRMAGVAAAVSTPIASAAVLPALAGSASQATTSGEASEKLGIGAKTLRRYAAAMEQPSERTGVQASQLHQTDSGAMNFE